MKKTSIFLGLALVLGLLGAGLVSAQPGFEVHKWTSVTGDWEWQNDHWQMGEYETATYSMDAYGRAPTYAYYAEPNEQLGTPWKYELEAHMGMNSASSVYNEFHAWTVNDPATTPATGGYTVYQYEQHDSGEFTNSHLVVSGSGAVDVSTHTVMYGETQQDVYVNVNN